MGRMIKTARVSVNMTMAYRKDWYFQAELTVDNTANSIWLGITNVAGVPVDGGDYVASIETGYVFVAKTPETFTYDLDGNMTSDGRWNYRWDGENRLVRVQSVLSSPVASHRRVEWTFDAFGRRICQRTWMWNTNSGTWQVTEDLKFVSDPLLFGRHVVELNATDNALMRSYVWGLDLSETLEGAGGAGGVRRGAVGTAPRARVGERRTGCGAAAGPVRRIGSPNGPYSYRAVSVPLVALSRATTFPLLS